MILWFWDGYVSYAICIFVISIGSICENLYEITTNISKVRKIALFECPITVQRLNQIGVVET